MSDHPTYRRQVLDHLGLVAGMFDALGIGDVLHRATQQDPHMRDLPVGAAIKALVLNGLGCINHARSLVPRFFHNTPTSRRISPRVAPQQLPDDALGRALDTLYQYGVPELSSLIAATAAPRLGLAPTCAHLDTTSCHVDGRSNSDQAPDEQVVHSTRGDSRDHRPDVHQVMLELLVEHPAGIPVLMTPLSGHRSDAQAFGHVIRAHIAPLHPTYGPPYVVADSPLYSAANLATLAQTAMQWITRVPATVGDAQAVLAHADPPTMAAIQEGYRSQERRSTSGGVEQRGVLISSAPRQSQAQRTVDTQRRQQSATASKAWKTLSSLTLACEAEARQALAAVAQTLQATCLATSTVRPVPRDGKRGRLRPGVQPDHVVDQIDGALASSLSARQARLDQHRCFLLATHALDDAPLPPHEVLAGDKGQVQAERGCRFVQDPQCFAASCSRKKPERIMALLMVMTGCLLVYAALEYRIRQALTDHAATFPDQKGRRVQHPTARWVFHSFVGMHVRSISGPWPLVLHLTEEHCHLLKLLGKPYMQLYGVKYS